MSTRGGGTRPGTGSGGRATSANRAGAAAARRARTPEEREAIQARWEARQAERALQQMEVEYTYEQRALREAQDESSRAARQAERAVRQEILTEEHTRLQQQQAQQQQQQQQQTEPTPTAASRRAAAAAANRSNALDALWQRRNEATTASLAANDEALRLARQVNELRTQLQQQHTNLRDSQEYQQALRAGRAADRRAQRTSMEAYRAQNDARIGEQRVIDSRQTDYNARVVAHPAVAEARARLAEAQSRFDDAAQRLDQASQRVRDTLDRAERAQQALELSRAGGGPVIRYGYSAQTVAATRAAVRGTFGRTLAPNDLAKLTGAKRGDRISLSPISRQSIQVEVQGAQHEGSFIVSRRNGEIVIHSTYVRNTGQKTGASGRNVVGSFQDIASLGVNKLEATAARGPSYNGYYTWARLGFTGAIPPNRLAAAQRAFGSNVTRVEQLMATSAGRHWWKQHGESWHATFDFTPGSYSMRELSKLTRNGSGGGSA